MVAMIIRRRKLGLGSCRGIKAASRTGIDFVRNDKLHTKNWEGVTHIIRWGCTSDVLFMMDEAPITINTSEAIHRVNDKAGFRRLIQDHDPEIVPRTWFNILELPQDGGPYIVRPNHHAQGRNLHYVENNYEANSAAYLCGNNYYISEYIQKEAEYRVYMVSGRVAGVARKMVEDPTQVAWNRSRTGCEFVNVPWGSWPLNVCDVAERAFKLSGLDFGGVDVMTDAEGRAYTIEINSACSLPLLEETPERNTIESRVSYRQKFMAKCFDYIVENGKEYIPVEDRTSWRGFVHPALLVGSSERGDLQA